MNEKSKTLSHPDDWQAETLLRLDTSVLYTALKAKSPSDPAAVAALLLVQDAASYATQRTKTILRHMGEFTLHDSDHLFRVVHLMARLLPENVIQRLSAPELMLLLLSAFFHDVGMAPSEKAVCAWRKAWDKDPEFADDTEREEFSKFQRYLNARPEQQAQLQQFIEDGANSSADLVKSYLVGDYIRITHPGRARQIIKDEWQDRIRYRDIDLTVDLATLCEGHGKDASELLDLDENLLCGPGVFACLPLVGVVLRLSDILDFDAKRTPPVLLSHLFVRHPVSIKEWSKHRSVEAWNLTAETIQFHAKCKHPAIEAAIHDFCDVIDKELGICGNILNRIGRSLAARKLEVRFPLQVDRARIETQKSISGKPEYIYRKTQFNLSKSQVIDLLMGTKLYGDPEVALRELIQNSIDACLLRSALESSWGNPYIPEIKVRYSGGAGEHALEITDNGTGMDQHIIDSYYSKIGSSFYNSSEFYDIKSTSGAKFTPTSRFGIGILSCFMVADTMLVDTRRVYGPHHSSDPISLTIEGQESIFWIRRGERMTPGTTTRLVLRKKKNPWEEMSEEDFIESVEKVVPNPPFKITIEGVSKIKVRDQHSFSKEITAASLKDHSWNKNPNIREFVLQFDNKEVGFSGSAIVAVLESRKRPVASIEMSSKTVAIDGDDYSLEKKLSLSGDDIALNSSTITIDEDGKVDTSDGSSFLCESRSRVSLHGIEIPTTLFPDFWNRQRNQVRLDWPLPVLLVLDVCSPLDLDLNSSRSQIIESEKWHRFEEAFAHAFCARLARQVSATYWKLLRDVLMEHSKNKVLKKALRSQPGGSRGRSKRDHGPGQ